MRNHRTPLSLVSRERGTALVLTLVIAGILLLVGIALSFVVGMETRLSSFDRNRKAARYVAETGLKQAEQALIGSFGFQGWEDDLDTTGALGRPAHVDGDQPPLSLADNALNRNGLVIYRWDPAAPGTVTSALWQVAVAVRGGNARFSAWVRNNPDDYGANVITDLDSTVQIVALGELLDANGDVTARALLAEIVSIDASTFFNYSQKGLGAGGTSTIEDERGSDI